MKKIKGYLSLMRIKHYIKNVIIFMPCFFGGKIDDKVLMLRIVIAFCLFSLLASSIYVMNDYFDVEKDKNHPLKCNRPIASGKVSKKEAFIILAICMLVPITGNFLIFGYKCVAIITFYFFINIWYSALGGKNICFVDILLLVLGYILRLFYGSAISGVVVSPWLYLVVLSGAFFLGYGKRRNELLNVKEDCNTRPVLRNYTSGFLEKNMYSCMTLTIVFYSLWCLDRVDYANRTCILLSIPILMIALMKYSLDIEMDMDGDPVSVICKDKAIILCIIIEGILLAVGLYF